MRKTIFLILSILAIGSSAYGATVPEDPWAHPRIWLAGDLLDSLQARAQRNTSEWSDLETWVLANDTETNPATWQVGPRIVSAGYAVNFALAFQADTLRPRSYAQAAYNTIIAIDSVADVASATYDTITIVTRYDYSYNTRFIMPAASLVYDWCYDSLTAGQRGRLANLLNEWAKDWYINLRDYLDGGSSCHTPSNNYFGGHFVALTAAGYALYYDIADYPPHYVSYARDTMAVQSANTFLGRDIIWTRYESTYNPAKGGLGAEGWPGYQDMLAEFSMQAFGMIASVEGSDACAIFGFSYPQEFIATVLFGQIPHTNLSSEWIAYSYGDAAAQGHLNDNTVYALETAIGLGVATNDTIELGKWWSDTYRGEPDLENYRKWIRFLFVDPTITPIDPEVSSTEIGDSWLVHGNRTAYYRNAWHDESANDISIEMRGGLGKNDHASNTFGSFRLNAGDYLVSTYDALADVSEIDEWISSGMWVSPDGNSGLACTRQYGRIQPCGTSAITHYKNSDTLLYYSVDVSGIYEIPVCDSYTRNSHIEHKTSEWIYIKEDSILLMMDRAITAEANYRRVEPSTAGCDTLWAAKESNKQWQIWSETEPTEYETGWRIDGKSDVADLVIETSYPLSGVNSSACYRKKFKTASSPAAKWRIVDSLATPATDYITLHAMKIVPDAGPFTFLTPTNTLGTCAVSSFRSNRIDTLDYIVAFSADSAAIEFAGDSIIIGHSEEPRENTRVILANMASSTSYYWKAYPAAGTLLITISKSDPGDYTEAVSDTAGILVFDSGAPEAGEECPTVTPSNIDTNEMSATSTSLYFETDYNVHGGFRYHKSGSDPWIYRHDADADSSAHTIGVSYLHPDEWYAFEINTTVSGCDSTLYSDSTSFRTLPIKCPCRRKGVTR